MFSCESCEIFKNICERLLLEGAVLDPSENQKRTSVGPCQASRVERFLLKQVALQKLPTIFAKGSIRPEYGKVFIVKSKILKDDMEEIFRFP